MVINTTFMQFLLIHHIFKRWENIIYIYTLFITMLTYHTITPRIYRTHIYTYQRNHVDLQVVYEKIK
jgi:hypothetical protein